MVVGASRGIGEATARILVAAGARVYLAACSMERLEKLAEEIEGVLLPLDLEDAGSVGTVLQGLMSELGGAPDIVVSAAGVFSLTPAADPGNAAYSSAKFGLRGLREVLTEELRGKGVRCSLIEPAATDTQLWDALDPDSDPNLPDRSQMLRPEDVAESILFVCTRPEGVQVPVLAIEHD